MPINPYGGSYTPIVGGANYSPYNNTIGASQYQQPANVVQMALVHSEEEGRNFPVSPGGSIFLMDSNNQLFYTKSVDFSGIMTFKKYQFSEVIDAPAQNEPSDYVTREEFEEWKASMNRRNNKPYRKERNDEPISQHV